jgi:hypothetical protein
MTRSMRTSLLSSGAAGGSPTPIEFIPIQLQVPTELCDFGY